MRRNNDTCGVFGNYKNINDDKANDDSNQYYIQCNDLFISTGQLEPINISLEWEGGREKKKE